MKLSAKNPVQISVIFLVVLLTTLFNPALFAQVKILAPAEGSVIQNNIPTITWKSMECDYYQIWINEKKMDSVSPENNAYVPFPLSFGRHQLEVRAISDGKVFSSAIRSFTVDDKPLQKLPEKSQLLRHNWLVQSSLLTNLEGSELSTESLETKGWYPTSVPATALSVLSRNGVYPNPYTGMNNMLIPDLNDSLNIRDNLLKYSHIPGNNPWKSPYWYTTSFVSDPLNSNKIAWLTFNEINYRADIWLNGVQIADKEAVVGMEQSFRFNISNVIVNDGMNFLAVAIYPPDNPGMPVLDPVTPLADPGQNMADGMISRDYTKWDALGWDWQPPVRDRDMGITEDVFVTYTDNIFIDNLYVTSDLPLPDTTTAKVTVSFDLINYGPLKEKGNFSISIEGHGIHKTIELPFEVKPYDTLGILLDAQNYSELFLKNPALWWPAGHGLPNLYVININAVTIEGAQSNQTINFGIREVGSRMGNNSRVFSINGKDIFCKAGNWVIDLMLNWSSRRYEDEVLLSKQAGINLLRVWGPTGAPPSAFYDAADKHGILLWQDFLNDFWGTFKNTPGYQPEYSLYEKATASIIKKYRNHPSLIIWCGGNEGVNLREKLFTEKLLPKFDGRDSKYYLNASDGDGLHGGGPYHTLPPADYFTHHKLTGFSSEIGPSGIPVAESVAKFMPLMPTEWAQGRFPIDGFWAFHDANNWPGEDTRKFSSYDDIVRQTYGPSDSTSVEGVLDYLEKCQLVNYEVYKAAIESVNRSMWDSSSGIALWKSNSSWPSMVWQVYDWYMQAHAGLFASAIANRQVHIQYNHDNQTIVVLNNKINDCKKVQLSANLYDKNMQLLWKFDKLTDLRANSLTDPDMAVPFFDGLRFLKLTVRDSAGFIVSDNFYWLYEEGLIEAFDSMAEPELIVECSNEPDSEKMNYKVEITNTGNSLAFMVAFSLVGKESGKEILPSFWSENYLNLLPGESKTLKLWLHTSDLHEETVIQYRSYKHKAKQCFIHTFKK
jgi:hypothetical protein